MAHTDHYRWDVPPDPHDLSDGCLMLYAGYDQATNPTRRNDFDEDPQPPVHPHAELGLGGGGPTPNDLLVVRGVADPLP